MTLIFKLCPAPLWREAERRGTFTGAPIDLTDGYIHFSTVGQVAETAARHFAGQADLLLVSVDGAALGDALRYEPSRGGALFPHLYGALPMDAVRGVAALPLGPDGVPILPDLSAGPVAPPVFDPSAAGWVAHRDDAGFVALVGPFWIWRGADGERVYGFLAEPRHLNRNNAVHGGMLTAFADQALGMAAWRANGGRRQVTIQLDTHFVDGVRAGEFVEARCRVVRQTGSLMFMSATMTVGSRIVATASGLWKI